MKLLDIYSQQAIFTLLIAIGVVVLVIIILRELMLWYWKVNTIVAELKEANRLLKKIAGENEKKNDQEINLPER